MHEDTVMRFLVMVLAFGIPLTAYSQSGVLSVDPFADVIDHSVFDTLWRSSKQGGKVRTTVVLEHQYQRYRSLLATATPESYLPSAQLAFWVNAYLACLLEVLHYRRGYRSAQWDDSLLQRDTFHIAQSRYSLRDLGRRVEEVAGTIKARSMLSTGSTSGPPLLRVIPTARTIRTIMHEQLRRLFRSGRYVRFDPAGSVLQLSGLFQEWLPAMEREGGSIQGFLMPWLSEETAAGVALAGPTLRIQVLDRFDTWLHAR